jgi:type VI secretion system protein ImpK
MREEIANLVHPVFAYALRLKERLERGETPDFLQEQSTLKGMLLGELEARRWPDYGGESGDDRSGGSHMGGAPRRSPDQFLGIRYLLACWLDEIFIGDSPWESQWNERKIEEALYGTNDRAWTFWEQAQIAEARRGSDSLEVCYLAVMLGFRGDYRDRPTELKEWCERIGKRLGKELGSEWQGPPELEPPSYVPPLRGKEKLQKMIACLAIFAFVLVPVVAMYLVSQLLR